VYYDGVAVSPTRTAGSFYTGNSNWAFGKDLGFGDLFTGSVDEVQVATTERSPAWIATEVANQSNPPAITSWTDLNALAGFVPSNIY
jgi:hypothetical protein